MNFYQLNEQVEKYNEEFDKVEKMFNIQVKRYTDIDKYARAMSPEDLNVSKKMVLDEIERVVIQQIENLIRGQDHEGISAYYAGWTKEELQLLVDKLEDWLRNTYKLHGNQRLGDEYLFKQK